MHVLPRPCMHACMLAQHCKTGRQPPTPAPRPQGCAACPQQRLRQLWAPEHESPHPGKARWRRRGRGQQRRQARVQGGGDGPAAQFHVAVRGGTGGGWRWCMWRAEWARQRWPSPLACRRFAARSKRLLAARWFAGSCDPASCKPERGRSRAFRASWFMAGLSHRPPQAQARGKGTGVRRVGAGVKAGACCWLAPAPFHGPRPPPGEPTGAHPHARACRELKEFLRGGSHEVMYTNIVQPGQGCVRAGAVRVERAGAGARCTRLCCCVMGSSSSDGVAWRVQSACTLA